MNVDSIPLVNRIKKDSLDISEIFEDIKEGEASKNHLKMNDWLKIRLLMQSSFFAIVLWIGIEYVNFVSLIKSGLPADISSRPPGVEGFLPISSMMELWLYIKTGIVASVHPAGVVLFAFAIFTSFIIRRGFCSWLCPVGFISEILTRLGVKSQLSIKPWKWLDIPLRSLKYLLMGFFVYAVLFMPLSGLYNFIIGDYNLVSDIKMMDLFAPPTRTTWTVIAIFALLTLVIKNFWCRYLCPYGAILGLFSMISPMSIKRNEETCIDCGLCDKACPSYLPVATKKSILSPECLSCQQCTAVCPVKDCLVFAAPQNKFTLSPAMYAYIFIFIFVISVGLAKISGYWQTSTDISKIRELAIKSEQLTHPRDVRGFK